MSGYEGFPFPASRLLLAYTPIRTHSYPFINPLLLRFCVNAGPRSIEPDNDPNSRPRTTRSRTPEETPHPAHRSDHGAFRRDLVARPRDVVRPYPADQRRCDLSRRAADPARAAEYADHVCRNQGQFVLERRAAVQKDPRAQRCYAECAGVAGFAR